MVEETLKGKIAIVTGSSKGIGAAICVELASRGATVVVNYPWVEEKADAEKVLGRIQATGSSSASQAVIVEADLATTTGPAHLIAEAVKRFSVVDILVNNAGVAIMAPLEEVTLEQWDSQVNLNARGVLFATQAALPHLSKEARIVVISSAGARQAFERSSAYHGTKSMVEGFVRSWALELGRKYGCTVNAVAPGPTNTSGMAGSGDAFKKNLQPYFDVAVRQELAEPEELANAVGFLCEPKSRWITGVCLQVNGGFFFT